MYTAIIIDDEPNAIVSLKLMIREYLNEKVKILDTATNVKEGAEKIKKLKPELVFLDIEMPNENGFELFKYFEQGVNFDVIFTTAYAQYGIQAVKCAALDYLLKPVQPMEIRDSLKRLELKKTQVTPFKQIEILLSHLSPNYDFNKIAIPTANGYEMFSIKEISYCEGYGNYSKIHSTSGKTLIISKTLQWLDDTLPSEFFLRIHKSYLVNMGHVVRFDRGAGNMLILDSGKELEVSSRNQGDLISRLLNRPKPATN